MLSSEIIDISELNMNEFVVSITQYLQGPFAIYLGWIIIHYLAAHAYSEFCVNWSWYGLITSPFISTTPICRGLSWVIYEGSNTITHLWLLLGTTISLYLKNKQQ
tara:strand:- start:1426 stop:1740 length:315 start_codon:yes stop_codon:yes gene_type:complete